MKISALLMYFTLFQTEESPERPHRVVAMEYPFSAVQARIQGTGQT